MIVRRGTFIFSCNNKGGIPMTLDKCSRCKMLKECKLYDPMRKMANEIERDLREEKMYDSRYM